MNRLLPRIVLLFVAVMPFAGHATALLPGDAARGQALLQANCTGCHDSRVYTRPDRHVKSVEGLIGQVNFCNKNLGGKLTREQVNDLVQYLNQAYYKFD